MSCASKAWSSETLIRGLDQVHSGSKKAMSSLEDPDPEALRAELARLEVTQPNLRSV